jgi:hypothetical protein
MVRKTFLEYLNGKGKTIEKAVDIEDLKQEKPPAAPENYEDAVVKFPAQIKTKPNDYTAKQTKVKDNEGLGDLGTPNVKFDAKSPVVDKVTEIKEHCGCEKKKAPFVVAYSSGSYHPDPIQAIKYIVYLTNENDNLLSALMKEAKDTGCLNKYANWIDRHYHKKWKSVI